MSKKTASKYSVAEHTQAATLAERLKGLETVKLQHATFLGTGRMQQSTDHWPLPLDHQFDWGEGLLCCANLCTRAKG